MKALITIALANTRNAAAEAKHARAGVEAMKVVAPLSPYLVDYFIRQFDAYEASRAALNNLRVAINAEAQYMQLQRIRRATERWRGVDTGDRSR